MPLIPASMCSWRKSAAVHVAALPYEGRAEAWLSVAHAEQRLFAAHVDEPWCAARFVSAAVIMAACGTAPVAVSGVADGGLMASALAGDGVLSDTSGFAASYP
jgi:hypothetical protein